MRLFGTLYRRIALLLFVLLLVVGAVFLVLNGYSTQRYQQEVMQRLNLDLARHLVESRPLLVDRRINRPALEELFHMLMVINPSIEIYLLDREGRVLAFSAPEGKVKRKRLSLAPIERFLRGQAELPLEGDDPRSPEGSKIFSAAPIEVAGERQGYLYVILGGEQYDGVVQRLSGSYVLQATLWILAGSLVIALFLGLGGTALITRRLRHLTALMQGFSGEGREPGSGRYPESPGSGDEIDLLGSHFNRMAERIEQQLEALKRNDSQRREMIANISHDLRTPLTSLHGYIETLLLKDRQLEAEQRREYLEIANAQSSQLIRLVSELFELAKLDSCETLLNVEAFSLAELVQDVVNRFRLEAARGGVELEMDCDPALPFAYGDIGLIQRVLNNLIENALRHTRRGGRVRVSLSTDSRHIRVEIADTGCGIPEEELPHIFDRFYRLDKSRRTSARHAGLGLAIAKRILDLHHGTIWARSRSGEGAVFGFEMAARQLL